MPRRPIGQEQFHLGCEAARARSDLDELSAVEDWLELDRVLAGISASTKGKAA